MRLTGVPALRLGSVIQSTEPQESLETAFLAASRYGQGARDGWWVKGEDVLTEPPEGERGGSRAAALKTLDFLL